MSWNRAQPMTPIAPPGAKVMILVPHRDEHDYRQWRDWFQNLHGPPGSTSRELSGPSLTTNRTQLVRWALESDATHIFFLDDDVIAPDNVIPALLAPNLPIVCGLYMAKKQKGKRCLAAWRKVSEKGFADIGLEQQGRHIEVEVTGLGCALIARTVFEGVPEPWFVWDPDGFSEDFFFFEKVFKEIGIKPVIDMECKCRHLGVFAMDTNNEFDTLG